MSLYQVSPHLCDDDATVRAAVAQNRVAKPIAKKPEPATTRLASHLTAASWVKRVVTHELKADEVARIRIGLWGVAKPIAKKQKRPEPATTRLASRLAAASAVKREMVADEVARRVGTRGD